MSFEYRNDFGAYRGLLAEMHPRQCSFCSGVHFDASDTDAPASPQVAGGPVRRASRQGGVIVLVAERGGEGAMI